MMSTSIKGVSLTLVFTFLCVFTPVLSETWNGELLVFTVATESNDGFNRFFESAKRFNYNVKVLGQGEEWRGGDVARTVGGGQKVRLLKEALEPHKYSGNLIIMFVDSYDLIFAIESKELLNRFHGFKSNVVFSAESFCWPNPDLEEYYPTVSVVEKRYLNSGAFIGYAPQLYTIVTSSEVEDHNDDQLFYSRIFLDQRNSLGIVLDTRSLMFQNLNGALDELTLKFDENKTYLYNFVTQNSPAIVHGNGPVKAHLNSLTNYIPNNWSPTKGCIGCSLYQKSLKDVEPENYPRIFVGIYLEQFFPFVEDFFIHFHSLTYSKNKLDILIHHFDDFYTKDIEKFVSNHGDGYNSITVKSKDLTEHEARKMGIDESIRLGSHYYFSLDGDVQIEKIDLLQTLIERNRSVVSPMLGRMGKMWTNFWGAVNSDGYYKRSEDYSYIVQKTRVGLWNVAYVSGAFLIEGQHLKVIQNFEVSEGQDADVAICAKFRSKYVFMYVDNQEYYGHLVDPEDFETSNLHNDLWMIFSNPYTWEKKYIHPDYFKVLHNTSFQEFEQPCPDVFWFPIVTDKFCDDLVEEMENNGGWSSGKNEDPRLVTGYENVPTVDIHMNQVNWEKHWLRFLIKYVGPINSRAFEGYYTEGRAIMNFVVRYRPDEQDRLKPHADSSTFTINLALNTPGVDYQGGGVRMVRYNCTVVDLRKGWMLMHPGRLTHHHEGLPTTSGTRYIMVSFVDP